MCWRKHWKARAEDVAPGDSKLKREIMSRGRRNSGLFLLLGVLRDWEAGIRTAEPCSHKGLRPWSFLEVRLDGSVPFIWGVLISADT